MRKCAIVTSEDAQISTTDLQMVLHNLITFEGSWLQDLHQQVELLLYCPLLGL